MNIRMSSKDFSVFPALWARIEKKINKLGRYFDPDTEVQVRLSAEGKRRIAEITIPFKGGILRAEECTNDMYQSIDNALIKIERQIRRHRTRLQKRLREDAFEVAEPEFYEEFEPDEENPRRTRLIRWKCWGIRSSCSSIPKRTTSACCISARTATWACWSRINNPEIELILSGAQSAPIFYPPQKISFRNLLHFRRECGRIRRSKKVYTDRKAVRLI